jgi:hypothetical protein
MLQETLRDWIGIQSRPIDMKNACPVSKKGGKQTTPVIAIFLFTVWARFTALRFKTRHRW